MNLFEKIKRKKANITIVGMGYVGLPLWIRFSNAGFNTTGFDTDTRKVSSYLKGISVIKHFTNQQIREALSSGSTVSSDPSVFKKSDIIIICLPTPLGIHNEPNLSYIEKFISELRPFVSSNKLIILESTTYPGTTRELFCNEFSKNFNIGKDLFIAYSPEREDPGNTIYETKTIPKIVGGFSKECLKHASLLYSQVIDKIIKVESLEIAEITKLYENIFRAINIGLANEFKQVCDVLGIEVYDVINAASTKPFGFMPFYPGPGLGGHCIPIDPFYLSWKAKEFGFNSRFIELAGEINTNMPNFVIQKLIAALNLSKKSLKGSKILVLGVAYKKNVDDLRESPSLEIIERLNNAGAKVYYSDPHCKVIPKTRKFNHNLTSRKITRKLLLSSDAILLLTDHDDVDYSQIKMHSKIIIDTRGIFKSDNKKIFRA